ncbi:branched-chain amino acid ABC transporter permease [Nocardia sp. NPDC051832]|uniref:branched-chain amino acid ABC transporter permease n=1 Tax=Nocardia sp. NPDC051832 TaxID=3155673 RepID=UPI003414A901
MTATIPAPPDKRTRTTVPRAVRRGRPRLYTSYAHAESAWNTAAKAWWIGGLLVLTLLAPFFVAKDITNLLTLAAIYAIGGIGLNMLTGYAGQVSLGHAFFVGVGAYTAAVFGGAGTKTVYGLGLDMVLWLPLTAVIPAILGLLVAPLAARVRGLYLATLTLGLVMIGEHVFKEWHSVTGGGGLGRAPAPPVLFGADLRKPVRVAGVLINEQRALYLIALVLLVVLAVLARNLMCSNVGRAFAAVRDRDVAAEIMGVRLQRTKTLAFVVSSAYAGVAGGLLSVVIGRISPERWNLLLSVDFLAIVLIGGAATITGSIIGACFVVLLPRVLEEFTHAVPAITSEGGQILGFTLDELKTILFGLLIAGVIVLEPRGMFGLWLRIRNYFRTWPFSH